MVRRALFFASLFLLIACGGSGSGAPDTGPGPDAAGDGTAPPPPGDGSTASTCGSDADCRDASYCNGAETCDPTNERADARGCVPGDAPDCDDGVACTTDSCDEEGRTCRHEAPDSDGDGHGDAACRDADGTAIGDDCDDGDANRFPGNAEVCNAADEDCNPDTLGFVDADGDGAASAACCNPQPDGPPLCGGDCRDDDSTIRPGVADGPTMACDTVDNDCDGTPDEGCPCVDGVSRDCGAPEALGMVGICRPGQQFCVSGAWTETCTGEVRAEMEYCDGRDNDCDGDVDEGVLTTYFRDADGDGFGVPTETAMACSPPEGFTTSSNDCDDLDENVKPTATEVCDGQDNNCAAGVDEGCDCVDGATQTCGPASEAGECAFGTQRCGGGVWGTCMGATLPFPEVCNGRDDDCDGTVDEGVTLTFYADMDGDGFGDASAASTGCAVPADGSRLATDCDDGNGAVSPSAAEVCDGVDNDCNGSVDPGCDCTDGDTRPCGPADEVGECAFGTQRCIDGAWAECVGAVLVQPESCNGRDDDCDGTVDDGVLGTFYPDTDGDGFGAPTGSVTACAAPAGHVSTRSDCDDARASVNPAAAEVCDDVDNDCDSVKDPGCDCVDGATRACGSSSAGACTLGTQRCIGGAWAECVGVQEPEPEACNGIDDDCDGTVDDGVLRTYYRDADGDGFGAVATTVTGCAPPAGYVANASDCDDGSAAVNPAAVDACDGVDNDCTGSADPGCACTDGATRSCGPATETGECAFGTQRCIAGAWAECVGAVLPLPESCNGRDDDCDGAVDDGVLATFYLDDDGDGFGDPDTSTTACSAPTGYVVAGTDCRDDVASINPAAFEACDLVDNNCDGATDPACSCTDGATMACGTTDVGVCNYGTQVCIGGTWTACGGNREPGTEVCNGLDDDCDGTIDDGVTMGCYEDRDGDTYGFGPLQDVCPGAGGYGGCPTGYASRSGDCNDGSGSVSPGRAEVCNAVDDDCSGVVDDGAGMECVRSSVTTCETACATAGQRTCSASCTWNEAECAAVVEVCNYCDDDRDGSSADDSAIAISTVAHAAGACNADYDLYGSGASCFSSQTQATLVNSTNQAGAIWREEPIYVGYDGFDVTVSATVFPCGGAAPGGWAIVFTQDAVQNQGASGTGGGLPTSSRGIAALWSFNDAAADTVSVVELTGSGTSQLVSGSGLTDNCGGTAFSRTQTMRFRYVPSVPEIGQVSRVEIYEVLAGSPALIASRETSVGLPFPELAVGTALRMGITASTAGTALSVSPILPTTLRSLGACDGPFDGQLRIDGGGTSGRLEIYHQGQWGSICEDSFTSTDALVACRQLGLNGGSARYDVPGGTGPIWLDDLGCTSLGLAVSKCTNPGWGVHNCVHTQDVGITCTP